MVISILIFILTLLILVLIHEFGHFLMAKKFGIKVEEFGFGIPPRIFGRQVGETLYSLNALPIGGFVRLLGEDLKEQVEEKKNLNQAFFHQSKPVRSLVLLAGVGMNFLLGVVLFAAIYTKLGIPEKVDYLVVTKVVQGSPAEAAGIKVNDKIIGFDNSQKFIDYINDRRGLTVSLTIVDKSVKREVAAVPRPAEDTPPEQGALGIAIIGVIGFIIFLIVQLLI